MENLDHLSIVFLDAYTTNPGDLDWKTLSNSNGFKYYERTPPENVVERALEAEILVVNKVAITREMFASLSNLKCICVAATGYDKIDISAASDHNIPVFNVSGYSRDSVAERVFSFMLHHTQRLDLYFKDFKSDVWANQVDFSYWHASIRELKNKTLGIIGMGSIGSRIDEIARVFGMRVVYYSRSKKGVDKPDRRKVELDELLSIADFVSLHIPLNQDTARIVNSSFLSKMKPDAVFINTSRGGHVDESALAKALTSNKIKAAYLDVLSEEPPGASHLLTGIDQCYVSPHTAWASMEARNTLMNGLRENIDNYQSGNWENAINYKELKDGRNS